MLVAGVDSSTQSCKVVLCDVDDGTVVGRGSAPHPDGTETDPRLVGAPSCGGSCCSAAARGRKPCAGWRRGPIRHLN
jgi:sugar (pentulose or hexulose) kinase